MKDWNDGISFEWDHHQYFMNRFIYTFGNEVAQWAHESDELFFALHGSHFNYYATRCKMDSFFSLKVTILLWDPLDFPSRAGAFMDSGYNAAKYLEDAQGYGRGPDGKIINQYAVWIDKFSNVGGN